MCILKIKKIKKKCQVSSKYTYKSNKEEKAICNSQNNKSHSQIIKDFMNLYSLINSFIFLYDLSL